VFRAKFFIPDLTEEEKSRLTLAVFDGAGNAITEGVHINGDTLTFILRTLKRNTVFWPVISTKTGKP
jgi:hypothetical protein